MLRFAMRDVTKEEIETEKQVYKLYQGHDKEYKTDKYKTIFKIRDVYVTVEKAEYPNRLLILTAWESSKVEAEQWESKK